MKHSPFKLGPGPGFGEPIKAGLGPEPINTSGISPTEFSVLIEPKAVETKTAGGILIPDETKERKGYAEMEGRIVASSPLAFTYVTEAEWDGHKPKPGDKVLVAKYAGVRVKGRDGKEYALVKDKDICATIED